MLKVNIVLSGLKSQCSEARIHLNMFDTFNIQTENVWKVKNQELVHRLNKLIENNPGKYPGDLIPNEYSWYLGHYQTDFPNTHRQSLFITLYSFLETELNQMCKDVSKLIINNKIKHEDFKGNGVLRAFSFLTKVGCFNWESFAQEWAFIKNMNKLRNIIVHNKGKLYKDAENKLNKFIRGNANLSGLQSGYVSLNSGLIPEFIETLIRFFEKLNNEVLMFIDRVNFSEN